MDDLILVLNAGSSSLKFSVFEPEDEDPRLLLKGQVQSLDQAPRFICRDSAGTLLADQQDDASQSPGQGLGHAHAIQRIARFLLEHAQGRRLGAVGHRVVHGGTQYTRPLRMRPELVAELDRLSPLAPLHQPHNLAAITALFGLRPDLPQVACFDTAFHQSQPELAQAYALPPAITSHGVRRYGFHGLSYEYIAGVLPACLPDGGGDRVVVAHLGNGASMCAMHDGESVASTMGFTAVDGLPMGTRCGSLDPGLIVYLMDALKMDARAIEKLIYKESGLLGVSGISSDMRVLMASADERARFAVALFTYRIGRELGSLAAALHGLDALVFTAGIGENMAEIRARVCRDAGWLGVEMDEQANRRGGPCISAPGSRVSAWIIPTNEERVIARHTRELVAH